MDHNSHSHAPATASASPDRSITTNPHEPSATTNASAHVPSASPDVSSPQTPSVFHDASSLPPDNLEPKSALSENRKSDVAGTQIKPNPSDATSEKQPAAAPTSTTTSPSTDVAAHEPLEKSPESDAAHQPSSSAANASSDPTRDTDGAAAIGDDSTTEGNQRHFSSHTAATLSLGDGAGDNGEAPNSTAVESGAGDNAPFARPTSPLGDSAIGPASDQPTAIPDAPAGSQQLVITLLLHATETRHPYVITEKYLSKRGVEVTDNNPVNMSVYTLKELIWRDWRPDWDPRPTSPTSIRLIHMGRLLEDKAHLKDSRFTTSDTPHIVHLTVKPPDVVDDEDARIAKGAAGRGDGSERSPRCRCLVM